MLVTLEDSGDELLTRTRKGEVVQALHDDQFHYRGKPCIVMHKTKPRECVRVLTHESLHCMIVRLFDDWTDDAFQRWHEKNGKVAKWLKI